MRLGGQGISYGRKFQMGGRYDSVEGEIKFTVAFLDVDPQEIGEIIQKLTDVAKANVRAALLPTLRSPETPSCAILDDADLGIPEEIRGKVVPKFLMVRYVEKRETADWASGHGGNATFGKDPVWVRLDPEDDFGVIVRGLWQMAKANVYAALAPLLKLPVEEVYQGLPPALAAMWREARETNGDLEAELQPLTMLL